MHVDDGMRRAENRGVAVECDGGAEEIVGRAVTRDELVAGLRWAAAEPGPTLVRVMVSTEQIATDFFLEDPVILARDFQDWLHDSEVPAGVKAS